MSRWVDDGDYWTLKERIHRRDGGKSIVSVKKGTINVKEFESRKHGKTNHKGAT